MHFATCSWQFQWEFFPPIIAYRTHQYSRFGRLDALEYRFAILRFDSAMVHATRNTWQKYVETMAREDKECHIVTLSWLTSWIPMSNMFFWISDLAAFSFASWEPFPLRLWRIYWGEMPKSTRFDRGYNLLFSQRTENVDANETDYKVAKGANCLTIRWIDPKICVRHTRTHFFLWHRCHLLHQHPGTKLRIGRPILNVVPTTRKLILAGFINV